MSPGEDSPVEERETQNNQSQVGEIRPECEAVTRGNTIPADLISTQPQPASPPLVEASGEAAGLKKNDLQRPTCPHCGLTVPENRLPPLSSGPRRLQGSGVTVESRTRAAASQRPAHTPAGSGSSSDSCFHLLLACLSCQCSTLLLGLLGMCSSCVQSLCSGCCHACARCCAAVQEVPMEELNCNTHCHSVLFQSCCEPTECLEFCLDCCDICHRT